MLLLLLLCDTRYEEAYDYKMLLFLSSLGSLLAIVLGAQQEPLVDPTSSPFTASFDDLVTQNLDRWHTPGLAIAVIHGEHTFSKV